ncbi:MAG: beta-galactosidase [Candidatus Hydrogenedentes bacterium]|nr:beta-galactosidase [Candidatus Hydrogenedentota bacterium]
MAEPGHGLNLISDPAAPYAAKTVDGVEALSPPENPDYFSRTGISFRVDDGLFSGAQAVHVIVEHGDQNIGEMRVSFDGERALVANDPQGDPVYSAAQSVVGYTCLGTGKTRHAIFTLDKPAFRHRQKGGADIRIEGCGSLRRVTVKTTLDEAERAQAVAEIPATVTPKVTLKRPMQWVLQVGADGRKPIELSAARASMRELCPVARALGFNGVESYVKWNFVEPEKGRFDWSFYDGVIAEAQRYDLKWFPLLIVGSAYTLPKWYHDSPLNTGFVCLEHRKGNRIQTIFNENQSPYVQGFLNAFGAHYEPTGALLGVRLGPSGNFGESQYPAGGNWGYEGAKEHIHIGWWAADPDAAPHFRAYLKRKYPDIGALNKAWGESYASFDAVDTFVPEFAETPRKRKDMVDWYMDTMSDWCERWAVWARAAMPKTPIYQSSGGWGFVESGTDFTDQTKSMVKVKGGIRATNETDSYAQNFYVTRMMSSAARFYGVDFGSEPAGFGSGRGVAARIFNLLVNNGQHLFFYNGNILDNDQVVATWLDLAPLLDQRDEPIIDVAVLYPDTQSKLDDGVFRNLYASSFYQRVVALRSALDFDFCGERMIADGALPRYKALVMLWNPMVEAETLNAIDRWVHDGGTVIYPRWFRTPVCAVEEDYTVFNRWQRGDTGKGKVLTASLDSEPPQLYADFVERSLGAVTDLNPLTQRMLALDKPAQVYVSALRSGKLAILNYSDAPATIGAASAFQQTIQPYRIALVP